MARMQPVGRVFSRFPKLARDVARQVQKSVELEVIGAETELDRNLSRRCPIRWCTWCATRSTTASNHRDASPRGQERAGNVRLSAQQEGDHVMIEVRDDGAGIDPDRIARARSERDWSTPNPRALSSDECLQLIFLPGFSTKSEVSDLSGAASAWTWCSAGSASSPAACRSSPRSAAHPHVDQGAADAGDPADAAGGDRRRRLRLALVRVVEVLAHTGGNAMWIDGQSVLDLREQPTRCSTCVTGSASTPPAATRRRRASSCRPANSVSC